MDENQTLGNKTNKRYRIMKPEAITKINKYYNQAKINLDNCSSIYAKPALEARFIALRTGKKLLEEQSKELEQLRKEVDELKEEVEKHEKQSGRWYDKFQKQKEITQELKAKVKEVEVDAKIMAEYLLSNKQ